VANSELAQQITTLFDQFKWSLESGIEIYWATYCCLFSFINPNYV